jgi:hypothetical protein
LLLLLGISLTSCKSSRDNPVAPTDDQLLVGTWDLVAIRSVNQQGDIYEVPPEEIAADPLTYILRPDGTGTQIYQGTNSEFSWMAQGDKLITTSQGVGQQYVYSVNSTTLTLTFKVMDDESGEVFTVTHQFDRQPDCPTFTTLKRLDQVTIEQWAQYFGDVLVTGAGAFTGIEVGPSNQDWDGIKIEENVIQVPFGDPCNLAAQIGMPDGFFCSCEGNPCEAVFTVGAKFAGTPANVADAQHNVFWDLHKITSPTVSILHHVGQSNCTIQCIQEYSCSGRVIGKYLITYTLTRDDTVGKTRVSVVKTPLVK